MKNYSEKERKLLPLIVRVPFFDECRDSFCKIRMTRHIAGICDFGLIFSTHLKVFLFIHASLQITEDQWTPFAEFFCLLRCSWQKAFLCIYNHGNAAVFVMKVFCSDESSAVTHISENLRR